MPTELGFETSRQALRGRCFLSLALLGLVTVGLMVVAAGAVVVHWREEVRDEKTRRILRVDAQAFTVHERSIRNREHPDECDERFYQLVVADLKSGAQRDAWNHPIYYRCPGPIHTRGWDLISCGPNGIYEEGQGDDIVVGEDLPPEEFARIMSSSTAAVTSESK